MFILVAERGSNHVSARRAWRSSGRRRRAHRKSIKQQKAKDKSAFIRIKNKLLSLLDEEDYPSWREVKAVCQKLCEVQELTMSAMEELYNLNYVTTDTEN